MKKLIMAGPKKSMLIDEDMPILKNQKDILIRLTYCGVCMSEHYDWSTAKEGTTFGHEPVGVVCEVGSEVTKFKPGDRVSGLFWGNAEYVTSNEDDAFLIPDSVSDTAAVLEPLACLISAVSKVKIPVIGEKVAVVGCGYMGCGAISLLKKRGAYVVGVDINPLSLENARRFGADEVYTPDDLPAYYKDIPGMDIGFQSEKQGFALVMEWGETNESLDLAIQMTRMCGQLAIGAYHTGGNRSVDIQQLNVKAIDCLSTHPREWEMNRECCKSAVKMLSDDSWAYAHVPTKVYPATMFDTAHRELPDKFGKYLKAVISWTDFDFDPYIKEN